jgi:hypothetical protein
LPLNEALAGKSKQGVISIMDNQTKDDLKTTALLATGTLTQFALLKSMSQSKTLTVMVIIGAILFGGLALFLLKMSGA